MAIAKTKSKTAHKDMAQAHVCTCQPSPIHKHLFLGGAITLLLVLATAQFALSRITWGEVRALRQEPEEVAVEMPAQKQVVVQVATPDYRAWIPQNFSFRVEEGYSVIGAEGAYAVIYKDGGAVPEYFGPQIDPYTLGFESVTPTLGLLDPAVNPVRSQIWVAPGTYLQSETVSQLKSVVDSIELIPISM
jgi:hypothetical protein